MLSACFSPVKIMVSRKFLPTLFKFSMKLTDF